MKNLIVNDALQLYGNVGLDLEWREGFTASDVAVSLAEHGDGDIIVRMNSGGGIAAEGMAIYSLLKSHPGKINVVVDGVAASAASLIAMAGDTVRMRDGAMLMIHDPSTITMGNAAAHEKNAAFLHKLADNYAGVYARAAHMKPAAARQIMQAETWYTAQDAVKAGFASEVLADVSVAKAEFDYRIYMHAPADLPLRPALQTSPTMITKGSEMTTRTEDVQDKPWAARFMRSAEVSGLPLAELNTIVEASASIDVARDALLARMAEGNANLPGPGGISLGMGATFDNPEFLGAAISEAIYCRMSGKAPDPKGPAQVWMGRTLIDMGIATMQVRGERPNWQRGRHGVAGQVLMSGGGHSRDDFPNLLQGSGQRYLLEAYQASASPLKQLARRRSADDFRTLNVIRLGEAPALAPVDEGGELSYGSRKENKESYNVKTFGKLFALTREALINDDLSAFADGARTWGMAAALCEADGLAAIYLANSGNGANLSDGNPIYTTARGNKISGGSSALSLTSVDLGRQALRTVKGLDGKTILNLVPKYLVVGAALENTALQICAQTTPAKTEDVNTVGGILTPIVEPRFAGNSWRLFADPQQLPALEIAYLNGLEGPVTEQRAGWTSLGVEFRCIFDFGCAPIEWRPTFYSAGS